MSPTTITAWVLAVLARLSAITVLTRRPWTTTIARRHNPPAVWSTPLFLETNMVMTGAWAVLFGIGAVLAALAPWWCVVGYGGLLFVLGRLSPRIGRGYSVRRLRAMGMGA